MDGDRVTYLFIILLRNVVIRNNIFTNQQQSRVGGGLVVGYQPSITRHNGHSYNYYTAPTNWIFKNKYWVLLLDRMKRGLLAKNQVTMESIVTFCKSIQDFDLFKAVLDFFPKQFTTKKFYLLDQCAYLGNQRIVRYLLDANYPFTQQLLFRAIQSKHYWLVRELVVERKLFPNSKTLRSAILNLCQFNGDVEILSILVEMVIEKTKQEQRQSELTFRTNISHHRKRNPFILDCYLKYIPAATTYCSIEVFIYLLNLYVRLNVTSIQARDLEKFWSKCSGLQNNSNESIPIEATVIPIPYNRYHKDENSKGFYRIINTAVKYASISNHIPILRLIARNGFVTPLDSISFSYMTKYCSSIEQFNYLKENNMFHRESLVLLLNRSLKHFPDLAEKIIELPTLLITKDTVTWKLFRSSLVAEREIGTRCFSWLFFNTQVKPIRLINLRYKDVCKIKREILEFIIDHHSDFNLDDISYYLSTWVNQLPRDIIMYILHRGAYYLFQVYKASVHMEDACFRLDLEMAQMYNQISPEFVFKPVCLDLAITGGSLELIQYILHTNPLLQYKTISLEKACLKPSSLPIVQYLINLTGGSNRITTNCLVNSVKCNSIELFHFLLSSLPPSGFNLNFDMIFQHCRDEETVRTIIRALSIKIPNFVFPITSFNVYCENDRNLSLIKHIMEDYNYPLHQYIENNAYTLKEDLDTNLKIKEYLLLNTNLQ